MKITIPTTNYTKGREGNTIDKIVLHWIVGNLDSCDATFKNPTRKASAHYAIEDTTIHQYVDEADTAWHAGNWSCNTQSIGIEHSGGELLADGKTRRKPSEATHRTSALLVKQLCKKYNIPIDRKHILKHSEVSDKATSCPGTLDIDYIIKLATESEQTMKPSSTLPDEFYKIKEFKDLKDKKVVKGGEAWDTVLSLLLSYVENLNSKTLEVQKQLDEYEKSKTYWIDSKKQALEDQKTDYEKQLSDLNIIIDDLQTQLKASQKPIEKPVNEYEDWQKALVEGRRVFILGMLAELGILLPTYDKWIQNVIENPAIASSVLIIPTLTAGFKAVLKFLQEKYGQGDYSKLIYKL